MIRSFDFIGTPHRIQQMTDTPLPGPGRVKKGTNISFG